MKVPDSQPKEHGRYICTKDMPYNKEYSRKSRWSHPDSVHVRDDYAWYGDGSYEERTCPSCGLDFKVTLPD